MLQVLLLMLGLVIVAGVVAARVGRLAPSERVYTLDEVTTGMRQSPRAWAGRTVVVVGSVQQMAASGGAAGALTHIDYLHPSAGVAVLILLVPSGRFVSSRQFLARDARRQGTWL